MSEPSPSTDGDGWAVEATWDGDGEVPPSLRDSGPVTPAELVVDGTLLGNDASPALQDEPGQADTSNSSLDGRRTILDANLELRSAAGGQTMKRSPRDAVVSLTLLGASSGNSNSPNENGFANGDSQGLSRTVLVTVNQGELFDDVARRVLWENEDLPESLRDQLSSQLADLVLSQRCLKRRRETRAEQDVVPEQTAIQKQILVQDLVDAYGRSYSAYNQALFQASPFPKAYHALVNSRVPHVFDTLLFVERELARPVQELISARDASLADLVKRYKQDAEALLAGRKDKARQEEADQLAAQHYEEMGTVQRTFASALADLTETQKRRYVALIEHLYAEYARAIGPERGSEAEKEVIAQLMKDDPECGRRMVLRAMEASNFGRSEGQLKDLGASTDESFLPVAGGSSRDFSSTSQRPRSTITVQMQALEDIMDGDDDTGSQTGTEGAQSRKSLDYSTSEPGDADGEETDASRSAVSRSPSPRPLRERTRSSSPLKLLASANEPTHLATSPAPTTTPIPYAPSPSPILKPENITHEDRMLNFLVGELISMGFDLELSQAALEMSEGRLDQAINLLLETPKKVERFISERPKDRENILPAMPVAVAASTPELQLLTRPAVPEKPIPAAPQRSVSSNSLAQWRESLAQRRSNANLDPEGDRSRAVSGTANPRQVEQAQPQPGLPVPSPPKVQPTASPKPVQAVQAQSLPSPGGRPANPSPVPSYSTEGTTVQRSPSRGGSGDSDKESSGSSNTLRRLGNLFGKAATAPKDQQAPPPKPKRNKAPKEEQQEPPKPPERFFIWEPDISESFTVWQGTHARTMYNLRLAVLPSDNSFRLPRSGEELALRAQTAQGLYGSSLSGVVVIVTRSEFLSWRVAARLAPRTKPILGTGILRTIFDAAQRTTEFHFDPLHEQFLSIETDLDTSDGSNPMDNVAEGDVFVSRHGNLPLVHVVFYLVMDEEHHPSALNASGQANAELTPRTPLVSGYRNLLRAANACDVNNLIIPLFLLPEPYLAETQDWNLLMRRCDQVCRSTKSFMTEAARNAQGGSGSGGYGSVGAAADRDVKTWQFIIPPLQPPKDRKPKETWEQRFPNFRDRFADVFRA